MADLERIRQEAINLEIGFHEQDGVIDLDKPGTILGGTFIGQQGQEEAAQWLANYRRTIEASDAYRARK